MLIDLDALLTRLRAELPQELAQHIRALAAPAPPGTTLAGLDRTLMIARVRTSVSGEGGLGRGRTLREEVAVVVQVRQSTGDGGAAADLEGVPLREGVITALHGWRPAADWGPLYYTGGRFLGADPPIYRWIETFAAERTLSAPC